MELCWNARLDLQLITHQLNTQKETRPVKQALRNFKRCKSSRKLRNCWVLALTSLLGTRPRWLILCKLIRHSTLEGQYCACQEKNGQMSCCIEFCDICTKDEFSLRNIDMSVDALLDTQCSPLCKVLMARIKSKCTHATQNRALSDS